MSADDEERKSVRGETEAILVPLGFRVLGPWRVLGWWNVIWYWGSNTGFAGGRTAEELARSAERQVFGGL